MLFPSTAVGLDVGGAPHYFDIGVHGQAAASQQVEPVAVAGDDGPAVHGAELIGPERQLARGGDLGVLLPQGPGGRVARIGEGLEPSLDLTLIELFERRHGHVHLATHLEHRRHLPPLLRPREQIRHGPDGGHVGGDVVPRDAVATGGGLHEATVLVRQGHGQPVDLELAHERRLGRLRRQARHTIEPRVQLVDAERVIEAHHGRAVLDRGE